MQAFLIVSPLPDWKGGGQEITEGLRIRHLSPAEQLALQSSDTNAGSEWWLCYDFDNPHPSDNVRYKRRQDAAFKLMLHAQYAIQVLGPVGAPNVFLQYRQSDDGLVPDTTQRRLAFLPSFWGRVAAARESLPTEIPVVLSAIRDIFQKPILRLQIPVWLLEQGLGAPDRHIRILLWATGLDGLTRSGGVANFAQRLCHLVGADTYIFPAAEGYRRPGYKVKDVAEDLYQLRTEMAHGLPFHEKFRKTRGFLAEDGKPLAEEFGTWRYDHVLEECAVFLLCAALRETMLNGDGAMRSSGSA